LGHTCEIKSLNAFSFLIVECMAFDATQGLGANQKSARSFNFRGRVNKLDGFNRFNGINFTQGFDQLINITNAILGHPCKHVRPYFSSLFKNLFKPIGVKLGANACKSRRKPAFIAHFGLGGNKRSITRIFWSTDFVTLVTSVAIQREKGLIYQGFAIWGSGHAGQVFEGQSDSSFLFRIKSEVG